MDIILTEDVKNLGLQGEEHEVADGYARNYLFPQQLAVQANERNNQRFKEEQEQIQERRQKLISDAQEVADELDEVSITLEEAASEEGNLYGSVDQENLLEALQDEGFEDLNKEAVVINEAISSVGEYTIKINLAGSIDADVEVEVVPA